MIRTQRHARREHEALIRQVCERRGITIEERGGIWRLRGPAVHITTADLSLVTLSDISPSVRLDRRARDA